METGERRVISDPILCGNLFVFQGALKWWSQKNEIHGAGMGLKLKGYAGSDAFAHGIHPPDHKDLSKDAPTREMGLGKLTPFM